MSGFDIGTLASFRPPAYLCEKCAGLLNAAPHDWSSRTAQCPICGVVYVASSDFPSWRVGEYLESNGCEVRFRNLIEQSRRLAHIATQLRSSLKAAKSGAKAYPPIRALFESLLAAECFVHFTSVGMSHIILGAMKMAALRVPVRGIVTNADESLVDELRNYHEEAPRFEVKVYERHETPMAWKSIPHQKIVIVDGLMAFKGSANLRPAR